jgi:restriction endonuclease S subunit
MLRDPESFQLFNGLWKGKNPPFASAAVIRNTNFADHGSLDLSDVAELDVEERQLANRRLVPGDVIIERSGGGPKQPVGRVCYFDVTDGHPYSFSNFTSAVRIRDQNGFIPRFVAYYLLYVYQSGATIPLQRATTGLRNLDWTAYTSISMPRPPRDEQARIVAALLRVQHAVETEEKLIETMRELKRETMDRMFSVGLRGGLPRRTDAGLVPDGWDVERLDQSCRVVSSSMSYTDLASAPENNGADAVAVMGIKVSDMNLPGNEIEIISANLAKRMPLREAERRAVPPGAVVFPKRGAAIATNKKRITTAWTILDPNLIAVAAGETIEPRFLYHWFQRFDLRTITEPGPTPQLNKKNLVPLLVAHPSTKEEQAEAAQTLDSIDGAIASRERKRAMLEELFTTLLEKLMTGEIRVDNLDIDTSEVAPA